ncbi:TPA: portal protein [Photobacterium damselae]
MNTLDNRVTAKNRFTQLSQYREPYLTRGKACAKVTIPALCPENENTMSVAFDTPYQSVGSSGVGSLASQLLTTMLPANESFFRFTADEVDMEKLGLTAAEADKALAGLERAITDEIEEKSMRVPLFEALKQLVVVGNSLLYLTPRDGLKVYRLDRYVVKRDAMGNIIEIIVKDDVSPLTLPIKVQQELKLDAQANDTDFSLEKDTEMYTHVKRTPKGTWTAVQEVGDVVIETTKATYPKDKCPWLALRLMAMDGEDYGRSYVEEFLGDLQTHEQLSKAMVEGSIAAARVLFLVRPNGTTRPRTLQELPNGGIGQGSAEDVSVLQMNKQADFSIVRQQLADIEQRLNRIFMVSSSIQRKGERVTAEEIRYLANALEKSLGGVYSLLSASFQLPLVNLLMLNLQKQKRLPAMPKGLVRPKITTGMSAIGRNRDLEKLQQFGQIALEAAQLQQVSSVDTQEYILRATVAIGIDPNGLVKTAQQIEADQEQAQQNQLAQQVAPQIAQGMMQSIPQQE